MIEATLIHADILKRFALLDERERLAHAYLLVGPEGVGKKETALALAKMLNCTGVKSGQNLYCNACPPCQKINSGNHPDVWTIEAPPNETIKIEEVRNILDQVRLRPFEANKKVFILRRAESLTAEAANALLKTLEEPTASSLLLLTTASPDNVIETVRSRCHAVHFLTAAKDKLAAQLMTYYHVNGLEAKFLAHYVHGSTGRAKELHAAKFFERKNALIDEFILTPDVSAFLKKLSEKEDVRALLDVLLSWTRDAVLFKLGNDREQLIHQDRIRDLERFQGRFTFEELRSLFKKIVESRELFEENLNAKLSLLIVKEMMR